nr:putative reverse transcriptase domain-containing protein [Tanacetum cinerariifolium]
MQAARNRQKSYADLKRKSMEFQVGDKVMLKVSPWKGVVRFGKRGKLNPRYVGSFKVLERVGDVSYKLDLSEELSRVHNTFHVSNLKKCHADEPLAVPLNGLYVDDKLHFIEEPIEIIDREVKRLKRSRILLVKVRWNSKRGPEFTWEREDQFRKKYPHLSQRPHLHQVPPRSWSIPSEDLYEEAAQQLLEQAPRSPEYVPDPIELEDHLRAAVPSTYHSLLPSGTPPFLPIPLPVPSTSRKAEIPEADTLPQKRLLLTASKPGCEVGKIVMSADFAVTYTSIHSEALSWSIPYEDLYEEAAQQLLEQAPRSPEYVPDPIELEDHVPAYIPEHPEDLVPAKDEAPIEAYIPELRAAVPSTYHSLLPSGTLPFLPIPLPVPSTSCRAEIPKADTLPQKRLLLTAPKPGCEVGKSSAAAAERHP